MKKEVEIKEGIAISMEGVSGNVIDVHKLDDCILFRLSVEGYLQGTKAERARRKK